MSRPEQVPWCAGLVKMALFLFPAVAMRAADRASGDGCLYLRSSREFPNLLIRSVSPVAGLGATAVFLLVPFFGLVRRKTSSALDMG